MIVLALLFTAMVVYGELAGLAFGIRIVFFALGIIFSILSFILKTAFRVLGFVCFILLLVMAIPFVLTIL